MTVWSCIFPFIGVKSGRNLSGDGNYAIEAKVKAYTPMCGKQQDVSDLFRMDQNLSRSHSKQNQENARTCEPG